ncbi:hypothetical protein CerSpe_241940 [Prunus speciosa]
MEKELFDGQVTKRGGGQVSRGEHDQPAEIGQTSKVSITTPEGAKKTIPRKEELQKFRVLLAAAAEERSSLYQNSNGRPKIQRVPVMLRDHKNSDKYYQPKVTAFGPIHHGEPKYERAEKRKLELAVHFVRDSEQNEADLLKKVDVNIKVLRECYDEEATKDYDDDSLAWMLFVDGCSTLEFIYKYDNLESFKIKRDQVAFAEQDMFLLENQLPYQLLKHLMISSRHYEHWKYSIESFVQMHIGDQKQELQPGATMEPEPTHLLEHLLTRMLGYPPKKSETSASAQPGAGGAQNTQPHDEHVAVSMEPGQTHLPKKNKKKSMSSAQSFRNVQELQGAGIHFRPSEDSSLGDIDFKSFICCGFLYLPKLKVDDSMGPKFMNLIAYEMCPNFQNNFGVTSYISFLDSLINHPDDVKHLRKKHILRNLLGSDEEVAQLFNEMGTDLVPNNAIYRRVKRMIEDHYQSRWKTWMGQFFYDHFSKPWILAFIGVLTGLGLSAVQTWYTANSDNPSSPCKTLLEYLKARGY